MVYYKSVLTNKCNHKSDAHHSMCDNLPKGALCSSQKLLPWTNVSLCSLDREKHSFCVQIWPSKYPFLLTSIIKQGQAGTFTPQWHPCYSVTQPPSVSPWLLLNISPCKYNSDTKVSYCTDSTVRKRGSALVPVEVCVSDIWGDLKFGNQAGLGSE